MKRFSWNCKVKTRCHHKTPPFNPVPRNAQPDVCFKLFQLYAVFDISQCALQQLLSFSLSDLRGPTLSES
jgi:hypothetical protein